MQKLKLQFKNKKSVFLALILSSIAILSRFIPHPANFTAIGAVALFSAVYLPKKWGILVALAIMLITDFKLGFYELPIMFAVYASFVLVGIVGLFVRKNKKPGIVFFGALSSSIIFFVITNFAVWAFTPWYTKTIGGLFQSYVLAVPFFRNMLLGDIIYTAVLFGVYELAIKILKNKNRIKFSEVV